MRLLRGKGRGREGDGVRRLDLRRGVWGEQGGLRAGRGEQREKNGGLGVGWWWVSRGVAKKSTKYLQKIGVCTLPIQRSFCLPPHAITHTRPTQLLSNICLVTKLVTVGNFHFGPRAVQFAHSLRKDWVALEYICQFSVGHTFHLIDRFLVYRFEFSNCLHFLACDSILVEHKPVKTKILVCFVHWCTYSQHPLCCLTLSSYSINIR